MATCNNCGTTILFGGVKDHGYRYCNKSCHQQAQTLLAAYSQIPEQLLRDQVMQVHQGPCPKCRGAGPVDVHQSHTIWSAFILTSWKSTPEVCCRGCGAKSKMLAFVTSGMLGWWGFPWGVIGTPIQLFRNVIGLAAGPDPSQPSLDLINFVRSSIAAQIIARAQQAPPQLYSSQTTRQPSTDLF